MNVTIPDKYFNPFTDFGFKKLFGTEVNKDLLMDFLNGLIRDKGRITEVKYMNSEQMGRTEYDRKAVFDIFCQTDSGEKFIVEMQKSKHNFFKDRSVFYSTFPISEQAERGEWDYQLKAVYMVGVLDFVFNDNKYDTDYYHTEVKLMDINKKTVFYEKLTFIYLEMPKFNKTIDELETHFEKWMYVLKYMPKLQELPKRLQERIFEKAFKVAEIAKMTKEDMAEYQNSLKVYRDWYSSLTTARTEGVAEGIAKGREEGETKKAIETALKMIKDGMAPDIICKYTGLTLEQVRELINKQEQTD
ncbi:MAG: Rpn family recombination-promoting nuclease/putative transposase [Chitinispirillales bacterium]|jgi:predicted transposase/invertase (TIGR01784 family)|nr:Rpn family recombination-promoting nuclease/putative transposase [Chitinispirillales bacterium]